MFKERRVIRMEDRKSMIRLKDLTKRLSDQPGKLIFDCGEVDGVSVGLLKNPEVAVANLSIPKGGTFPTHLHKAVEVCVMYEGEMLIAEEGVKRIIKAGQSTRMDPNVNHYVTAITDCKLIVISIPADEGYPDATRD